MRAGERGLAMGGAAEDRERAGRSTPRAPLRALGALALLLLAGCATPIDGGRGLPPLFERIEEPLEEIGGREFHLWPILGRIDGPDLAETRILWPLGRDKLTPLERRSWLFPAYHRWRYTHIDGSVDRQNILLLVALWGEDAIDGSYFALFPLGGTAKGIFGLDRMDFALFPLWLRSRDRDRVSNHVLWPFIHWSYGVRLRGWRIFPFYSSYRGYAPDGTLRYDRRGYLWPFIIRQENDLETDAPTTVRWVWPFYGSIESDRLRRYSVLWPLLGKDVYPRRGRTSYHLFPFLRFSWEGGELVQYDIYPFVGHRESGGTERDFLIWPIFGRETTIEDAYSRRDRWFFPFWRRTVTRIHESENVERLERVWPLFRYHARPDGVRTWSVLDPIPYVDLEGLEWFYSRIWRVYREVDDPGEGRRAWELLWGVAAGERSGAGNRFSILGGLFGRERRVREGGESDTRWRLLYIPF